MSDPLLSIIVPVYKTEKTLCRCLDSIFSQLNGWEHRVEVLAVNDYSPDSSDEILASYQQRHSELVILRHECNQGEAGAHNTGITRSHGVYYTFLDSDDTFANGAIARFISIIELCHPDLIHYAYARVDENGTYLSRSNISVEGFYPVDTSDARARKAIFHDTAFGIMTAGAVYRRTVAPDLRMRSEFPISGERYYGWQFFANCKTVYLLNEMLYNYYQYSNTISRVFSEEAVRGLLELDVLFWKEMQRHPQFKSAGRYALKRLMAGLVWRYSLVFEPEVRYPELRLLYFRNIKFLMSGWCAFCLMPVGCGCLIVASCLRSSVLVKIYFSLFRFTQKLRRRVKRSVSSLSNENRMSVS